LPFVVAAVVAGPAAVAAEFWRESFRQWGLPDEGFFRTYKRKFVFDTRNF
jgi:hypothetical protein